MNILLPETKLPEIGYEHLPLFFLAGPILGGGDWQSRMSELLIERSGDCVIVNPSRYKENHPHYQYRIQGVEDAFEHQTAWEREYIRLAAKDADRGCLIFWLGVESKTEPRDDGDPYAGDTRGEVGEWRGHLMHEDKLRVVMGAEDDFPRLRTIQRNSLCALGPEFRIFNSMEDVVNQAVWRALSS